MKTKKPTNKYRTLISGSKVREYRKDIKWEFSSKCPDKWLHIDCENGQIYVARDDGGWKEPSDNMLKSGLYAIVNDMRNKNNGY